MRSAWITGFLALTLLQSAPPAAPAEDEKDDASTKLADDLEIMQRVLNKALAEHYARLAGLARVDTQDLKEGLGWIGGPSAKSFLGLTVQNYRTSLLHSADYGVEGFYAPGVGAIFTLNIGARAKTVS